MKTTAKIFFSSSNFCANLFAYCSNLRRKNWANVKKNIFQSGLKGGALWGETFRQRILPFFINYLPKCCPCLTDKFRPSCFCVLVVKFFCLNSVLCQSSREVLTLSSVLSKVKYLFFCFLKVWLILLFLFLLPL